MSLDSAASRRGAQLPRLDAVPHPHWWFFYTFSWFGRWAIRRAFRVRVLGAENVPADGPVILASNHVGVIDGPLLALFSPRPVHALTKDDMFKEPLGAFLRAVGQIPLDRHSVDPAALKSCLRVLRDGRAIGIYPEGERGSGELDAIHGGAAYLALVSGAPIVPVSAFGSREPGGSKGSLPRLRSTITLVYGPPLRLDAVPWPRTKEQVARATALVLQHMRAQLAQAKASTGLSLPGPLPQTDQKMEAGHP